MKKEKYYKPLIDVKDIVVEDILSASGLIKEETIWGIYDSNPDDVL